jgi:KipI family sensor histidine kinase inhibitor
VRVLPCGDSALLVEVASLHEVLGLDTALREDPLPGVAEVVPAARTLLLRLEPGADPGPVRTALGQVRPAAGRRADAGCVEVPVAYDGEDLEEVGRLTGLGARGVIEAHTAADWVVAFCGFAPGFGYLTGSDPRLHVPRRDSPRTRVPAGSVALAGEYAGVYPRASPGGWQLLGHTDLPVWDLEREPPALLQPGTRVRFVAVGP